MESEHSDIPEKRKLEDVDETVGVKKFKPNPDEGSVHNGGIEAVEIKTELIGDDINGENEEEIDPFHGVNNSEDESDTEDSEDNETDEDSGDEDGLKINEEEEDSGEFLLGDEEGMLGVEASLGEEEEGMFGVEACLGEEEEGEELSLNGMEMLPPNPYASDDPDNDLQCKKCFKTFARKSYLRGHSCSEDLQINNKALECPYCHKRYSHRINLRLHLKLHNNPKQFQCHLCLKYLSSSSSLKVHLKTHSNEKAFKCPYCGTAFNQKVHLNDHILSHHTNMRPFNCQLCNKTYVSKSVLKKHLKKHLGLFKYSCEICTKRFFERSSLKKHMRTHTSNFPLNKLKSEEPLKCHSCLTYFHFKYKLITHQMLEHGLGKEHETCYQCPLCDIKFNILSTNEPKSPLVQTIKQEKTDVDSEKGSEEKTEEPPHPNNLVEPDYPTHLNDHKTIFANLKITPSNMQLIISEHIKSHQYVENHMCELCYKVFETRENLMRHLKIHDDKERKRFKCEQCDKRFTSNADLNKHSNAIHQRLKLHECDMCGKNFSQRNNLKRHLEEVHRTDGMKFECYVCSKVLATSHSLKRHILIHNGPKYTCEICKREFTRVYELNIHKKMHDDENNTANQLKCQYCGKVFLKKSNLKAHIENNHLDYSCLECKAVGEEVTFDTKKNLLLHLKTKHKNVISNVYLTCEICFKTHLTQTDLARHMKMHSDDYQIQCKFCDKYFSRNYNLKQHMKSCTKNISNGILDCDDDDLPYNNEDDANEMLVPEIKMEPEIKLEPKEEEEDIEESEEEQENFMPVQNVNIKRETDPLSVEDIINAGEVSITPIPGPYAPNNNNLASKITQCQICLKTFAKKDSLRKHMKVFHTYISPDAMKQEPGQEGKPNILEVILQEGKTSNDDNLIQCEVCKKTFTRKDSLRKHTRRFHILNNTDVKKEFTEGEINRNMLEVILKESGHEIKSRIPCELCYKTFTRKDSLRKHIKIFHTRRSMSVLKPDDSSNTMSSEPNGDIVKSEPVETIIPDPVTLPVPVPADSGVPVDKIPCALCDKTFTRKDSLKKHIRVFHTHNQDHDTSLHSTLEGGEGGRADLNQLLANAAFIDRIRCELCDKSFTRKDSLRKHNKIFHGGADPRTLDEHMATGSAEFLEVVLDENAESPLTTNEILCRICNKTFTRNYNLKKHMKTVHKIDENMPYFSYDNSFEMEEEDEDMEVAEQFGSLSNSMLEVILDEQTEL
uniref:Zinc finger protein Xfin n=1 Tax=Cacopsylla melanoneura TaxID=428564 RepID=A0A8D8Q513_9HEMI